MADLPSTPLLDTVDTPDDLRKLQPHQLRQLADELRAETISAVGSTGGHLGSGLANSVYRILDLFVGSNLARRVESANAYMANTHPDCLHDCIFLVCDSCGQTTHIDDDSITKTVRAAAKGTGFSPERPVIEVRGKCADCD